MAKVKWVVGAYEYGRLVYDASIPYDDKDDADAYCDKCIMECATKTGKTYKVYPIEAEVIK